jgi:hypothetical protein
LKKAGLAPAIDAQPPVTIKKVDALPPREVNRPVRTLPPRRVIVDEPALRGPPVYRPLRFGYGYGGGFMRRPMGFAGRRY